MAPGGALELLTPIQRPFTASLREGFDKGTKLLYISGEIRYTDAFGTERFTKYRFVYGGNYGSGEGLLATAEEGNEANYPTRVRAGPVTCLILAPARAYVSTRSRIDVL